MRPLTFLVMQRKRFQLLLCSLFQRRFTRPSSVPTARAVPWGTWACAGPFSGIKEQQEFSFCASFCSFITRDILRRCTQENNFIQEKISLAHQRKPCVHFEPSPKRKRALVLFPSHFAGKQSVHPAVERSHPGAGPAKGWPAAQLNTLSQEKAIKHRLEQFARQADPKHNQEHLPGNSENEQHPQHFPEGFNALAFYFIHIPALKDGYKCTQTFWIWERVWHLPGHTAVVKLLFWWSFTCKFIHFLY